MFDHSESRISVTIDLSSEEAADLASSLARATPSMLIPLTGLSGLPSVEAAARLATILGGLTDALARAGYPAV
jgi:hypothetical protein